MAKFNLLSSGKILYLALGLTLCGCSRAPELRVLEDKDFPYQVDAFTLSVDVDTHQRTKANDNILGTNTDMLDRIVDVQGWNHQNLKDFVRRFRPTTVRFPVGVFGNFYDWRRDVRYLPRDNWDLDDKAYGAFCSHPRLKVGIDGLAEMQKELGFDLLWVWCLNHGSIGDNRERIRHYIDDLGVQVRDIELGNELYFLDQRSELINENGVEGGVDDINIARIKAIAEALREEQPSVRLGLPFSWWRGEVPTIPASSYEVSHASYNNKLCSLGTDFFDAIIAHKYIGERNSAPLKQNIKNVMEARLAFESDLKFYHTFAKKPIWLTEWALNCGDNACGYLSMADSYLYFYQRSDVYEHVTYYHTHDPYLNSFYNTLGDEDNPVFPKSGFGAVFEILRGVFEGSYLLETTTKSAVLTQGVDAVSARAVQLADGSYSLIVVNRSNRDVVLNLKVNNHNYNGDYKCEYLSFNALTEGRSWSEDAQTMSVDSRTRGAKVIRAYSVSVISELEL